MSKAIEQDISSNDLSGFLGLLEPGIASIFDNALAGNELSIQDCCALFAVTGLEYNALVMVADELRRRSVGNIVTYVVNRNINFTNVCVKRC